MADWSLVAALLFYLGAVVSIAQDGNWGMAALWFALGVTFTGQGLMQTRDPDRATAEREPRSD